MDFDFSPSSEKTQDVKVALTKERSLWRLTVLERLLRTFSPGERLALYCLTTLMALSSLVLLVGINNAASVLVPARGGTLTEGEVGPARFINPVLTISQPDEDLTELVYSGLMRAAPDGTYVPDLAERYDISSDGTTYTFHLRPDATFQDGTKVTAADILYTVQQTQNPAISSPRRADWAGVQVSSPDAETVVFKLPRAYAPFLDNTTMGILPKHIWSSVSAEEFPFNPANTHPIGSGPYRVQSVSTDSTGSPIRYELVPFTHYALGSPDLSHITLTFYASDSEMLQALNAGRIDAVAGVAPQDLKAIKRTDLDMVRVALPRVFGVFFNQSHAPVLADLSARQALDAAVDKQQLVADVLGGYGTLLQGPVPPNVSGNVTPATPVALSSATANASSTQSTLLLDAARSILQKGGWKFTASASSTTGQAAQTGSWSKNKQTLSLTLATADEPELVATANEVAADWRALGVQVSVQVYSLSDLNENVIRPRSYDALLFGEVVGRTADFFAFWASSQRNDPGLNLALYTNSSADTLLAQARATTDETARDKLYAQFATTLEKTTPAVFLYSPDFIYVVPQSLHGVKLGALTSPSERFLNVYRWYTETEHVWSIFTNEAQGVI